MKILQGDTIHPARAMDPEAFRAQATGIGHTARASRMTGAMRAQRVVDSMDPACRALVPAAEGYPKSTAEQMASIGIDMPPNAAPTSQPGDMKDIAKRMK